jgi:ribonuclease E
MHAGVGKLDGLAVSVADASKMIGKKVKVRVERVLNGTAYATLVQPTAKVVEGAITAESEAEKPTRAPRKKKVEEQPKAEVDVTEAVAEEPAEELAAAEEEPPKPKKKTRRGSRGGRGRKKKPAAAAAAAGNGQAEEPKAAVATIHVPSPELGKDGEAAASADGEQLAAPKKKRTRRGSRGGRNRRKKPASAQSDSGTSSPAS